MFKWCIFFEKGYMYLKNDFLILIKYNKIKKKSLKGVWLKFKLEKLNKLNYDRLIYCYGVFW